jgi:hypothetical protein
MRSGVLGYLRQADVMSTGHRRFQDVEEREHEASDRLGRTVVSSSANRADVSTGEAVFFVLGCTYLGPEA